MTPTATEYLDCNPPFLYPDYEITKLRAPSKRLVELPKGWFHHTPGPVFGARPVRPSDADLTQQHDERPIGQRIVLHGRVLDSDGRGVPNALLEIWQANAAGYYVDVADPKFMPRDPNFTGAGRCLTESDGSYRFVTVRPAAYAQDVGSIFRPSHIHFSIFGTNLVSRIITQCYFEGDPLILRDPIVQAVGDQRGIDRMIAKFQDKQTQPGGYDSALVYHWDIVLRGRDATPTEETGR